MPTNPSLSGFTMWSDGKSRSKVQGTYPAGYILAEKMPKNVVFPRPDIETQAHARQKWAHTQMKYEVPIGIQGGCWPFRYEIIYDETGAGEIGSFHVDDNYGVFSVQGSALTSGNSYAYTVRVHPADGGGYVDVSRTLTVDDTKFVFVQDGYAGTKVGTISQPLESIPDWWGGTISDATYHNKIMVFRTGLYNATMPAGENTGNMRLQASTKTCQIMAFPNETPVWDLSTAKIFDDSTASNDMFIAGITFQNARNDVLDAHYFWIQGLSNRVTFWRNTFKDMAYGTAGTDNTGPIFIASTAVKNYLLISGNHCEDVLNSGAGNGTLYTIYRFSNVLIEGNTARNCSTNTAINAKATLAFVTIRNNTAVEGMAGIMIGLGYGSEVGAIPHDHEICWNNFKSTSGDVIMLVNSNTYVGQHYNTWLYRNSLQGGSGRCQYAGTGNFLTDSNFLSFASYTNWNEAIQTSVVANIKSTAIDATGKLTSALGYGTHGHGVL